MAHVSLNGSAPTVVADGEAPQDEHEGENELSDLVRVITSASRALGGALLERTGAGLRVAGTSGSAALPLSTLRALKDGSRSGTSILANGGDGALELLPLLNAEGSDLGLLVLAHATGVRQEAPAEGSTLVRATVQALEQRQSSRRAAELEDALAEAKARYRLMAETVSIGIAVVSPAGSVEEINLEAAGILGDLPENVIGRDFRKFVAPEDLERTRAMFEQHVRGELSRHLTEFRIARPTGELRLLQVSSSGIVSDSGLIGVFFAARDITEERERIDQLRRAERLASVAPLLGGVCHELNNPLTSIKSFAELMLLDDREPEDVESLEIIQREAERAGRIVSDLRVVARQTQEEAASATALDLNSLIHEACDALRPAIVDAGIEVSLELASELPLFYGIRTQIERVVMQLLTNAVQALREESDTRRVIIRTAALDGRISLTVSDTGPGIAPEHIDHVFDPFFTTRASGEGTGLGLSLVHSVITNHHGQMRVDGGWGRGAAFHIELPIASKAARPGREAVVQSTTRTALRILVVDDEGPIRYSLARYLERRGHTVRDAAEGRAALEILGEDGEEPFDIILADLRMPGLSGEQLYGRLRMREDGMQERLIFITGDAESPEAARLLEEAGVPVVLKPFDLPEIAQIIETHADVIR